MNQGRILVALGAAALMTVPAGAAAKGGGGGGGGCTPITSDEPGKSLSMGKQITQSWTISNCTTASQTIKVSVVPDAYRIVAVETGEQAIPCAAKPFTAGTVTLKAGDKQSLRITVPADPCYASGQWRLGVNFNATARSGGVVLGTAFSAVTVRNRA